MDCIVPEDIAYCQNGGTCRINLLTESLSCVCTSAYVGDACEQGALGTTNHQSFSLSGSCFIFEDVMCRRIYNRHVRCLLTLQMWMNASWMDCVPNTPPAWTPLAPTCAHAMMAWWRMEVHALVRSSEVLVINTFCLVPELSNFFMHYRHGWMSSGWIVSPTLHLREHFWLLHVPMRWWLC